MTISHWELTVENYHFNSNFHFRNVEDTKDGMQSLTSNCKPGLYCVRNYVLFL